MHNPLQPNMPKPSQAEHLCLRFQLLLDLATVFDALQYALTILVELQLGDDDLRGVHADGDGLARGLVLGDPLDVDDIFETVDGGDLAFAALVGASDYSDFIVLSDGDRSDLKLYYVRGVGRHWVRCIRTLYFSRSSLLKGALMIVRLTLEGAS